MAPQLWEFLKFWLIKGNWGNRKDNVTWIESLLKFAFWYLYKLSKVTNFAPDLLTKVYNLKIYGVKNQYLKLLFKSSSKYFLFEDLRFGKVLVRFGNVILERLIKIKKLHWLTKIYVEPRVGSNENPRTRKYWFT